MFSSRRFRGAAFNVTQTGNLVGMAFVCAFSSGPEARAQGMSILEVIPINCGRGGLPNCQQMDVVTTGAQYTLQATWSGMTRRIDPATNTVNPRVVSRLDWPQGIGTFRVVSESAQRVVIESDVLQFDFRDDSLLLIRNLTGEPFEYTHTNVVQNPEWVKETVEGNGGRLNRIWTDGYGGSLHARAEGPVEVVSSTDDATTLRLAIPIGNEPSALMAHMVFPPRFFDFEGLYGSESRPTVFTVFNVDQIDTIIENAEQAQRDGYVGIVHLFHTFYPGPTAGSTPIELPPEDPCAGFRGYQFREDGDFAQTPAKIRQLADPPPDGAGFKVITYFSGGGNSGWADQSVEDTLAWMECFQQEYELHGWYFDNADYRQLGGYASYQFIRAVREQVGPEGILYHHDSVDVIGRWSGFRSVMIDVHMNYSLAGETGEFSDVTDVNEQFIRYYVGGYGLSQAYGTFLRGTGRYAALYMRDYLRAAGENLHLSPTGQSRFPCRGSS